MAGDLGNHVIRYSSKPSEPVWALNLLSEHITFLQIVEVPICFITSTTVSVRVRNRVLENVLLQRVAACRRELLNFCVPTECRMCCDLFAEIRRYPAE